MKIIKLNLGSGIQHKAGYINIDKYVTTEMIQKLIDSGHPDAHIEEDSEYVQADLKKMPFPDNYADYIESIDVIEHFGWREVDHVIAEMKRVMKPGAMARIHTIDFSVLALEWTTDITLAKEAINIEKYIDLMMAVYGNQVNEGQYHKMAWTPIYAHYEFITVHEFSKLEVLVYPKGCSSKPPMETMPWGPNVVQRHQALVFEVTK